MQAEKYPTVSKLVVGGVFTLVVNDIESYRKVPTIKVSKLIKAKTNDYKKILIHNVLIKYI